MANRRSAKTIREIKQAFLTLLQQKSLEKIRVAEVVTLAEISRATFYLHFEDIYAVYNLLQQELLEEWLELLRTTQGTTSKQLLLHRIRLVVDYVDHHKALLQLLVSNGNLLTPIHSGAVALFLEEFYPEEQTDFSYTEVNFVVWGLLGTLQDWVVDPAAIDKEELVGMLTHIMARFIPLADS